MQVYFYIFFCVAVHCPDLEHPANGKVMYGSTKFNSPATYECKYGYMLVGEATRRCGPNKRWSGQEPQCKGLYYFLNDC